MSTSFSDLCADTCQLSGFGSTDEIRLVVTSEDGAGLTGKVRLTPGTSTTALEAVTGYNDGDVSNLTSTYSELAFVGTQAEINAVLPELQYKGNAKGDFETVSISATLAGVSGRTLHYFPGTGHYYEYVDADIAWSAANTAAATKTFNGLSGYLVTILTEDENDFIKNKVTNPNLWMGAQFTPDNSSLSPSYVDDTAGAWEWVTGPTSDRVEFWSGTRSGESVTGKFANWNENQPDGSSDCAVTNYNGGGLWDDFACSNLTDYLVEYGGLDGESPTLELRSTLDVYVPYTVTYDANEDQHQAGVTSGSQPSAVTVKASSDHTVLGNTGSLARVGFTFDGWNTSSDGSGTDYSAGASITVSADTTLYAQWGIPGAARLFGQTDDDGNRTESVIDVTGDSGTYTGNVRGITTDGSYLYYLPFSTSGSTTVWTVNFDGTVEAEKTVTGSEKATNVMKSASSDTARRDLAYSSGCIFVRGRESTDRTDSYDDLYCIDITGDSWSITEVSVPDVGGNPGMPVGQGWALGSILDFPDGKIAVVGKNSSTLGADPAEYAGDSSCPADHYCKTLRIFDVSGSGSSVTVSHEQDILLADTESNWPQDNHGIASDGTYLFQSYHEHGYKTWGLQSGVSYIVFNGDGDLDVDGTGGTYRSSAGHADNCGANTGVSGGFCPINPEVDVDSRNRPAVTRQMTNTTYFSRDHTNQRYIMGDYQEPKFLLTEAATDQPESDFTQPAPSTPSSVGGSSANGAVTVSWGASSVSGGGSISYTVTSNPGSFTCTTSATSCQVTGLTNGTSYTFSVIAKVGSVNSDPGVSGTIVPALPSSSGSSSGNDDDEPVVTPVVTPNVTRPTVRLPFPTPMPPRPTVLSGPVAGSTSGSTLVDRFVSRVGGVPAPVSTSSSGDDELSVSTSSLRLSLKMSQPGTVTTLSDDVSPELTIKPGARAAVTGSGLLPNTSVQVWLPNVSDRELGRLLVNGEGEIQGELGLSSSLGEDPLPVGRQTLQMTGYDTEGNQTVVEMPVNIAQGPPTPEPNREVSALPDLSPGQSLATSAGVPTTVVVTPFSDQRVVAVDGGDWSLSVALADQDGDVGGTSGSPFIRMTQSGQGSVTGDGFQPGTVASLWMFSEPTLLGTVTVAEDGAFDVQFLVDAQFIAVGEHTLQVQGVGTDGYIKAANLGVLVDPAPAVTTADSAMTMIWWVLAAAPLVALLIVFVVTRRRRQT